MNQQKAMPIALLIIAALVAWWLLRGDSKAAAVDPGRRSRELDVDANVNSPYFGMTDEEIAEAKRNPAVNPDMRRLIDQSNAMIDGYVTTDPSDTEAP